MNFSQLAWLSRPVDGAIRQASGLCRRADWLAFHQGGPDSRRQAPGRPKRDRNGTDVEIGQVMTVGRKAELGWEENGTRAEGDEDMSVIALWHVR